MKPNPLVWMDGQIREGFPPLPPAKREVPMLKKSLDFGLAGPSGTSQMWCGEDYRSVLDFVPASLVRAGYFRVE